MLSKIKPVPRMLIIVALVGTLGYALNEGLNRFGPKKETPEVTAPEVTAPEAPEIDTATPAPSALEKANTATAAAVEAAPSRELDASESRGMRFLLKEGK